jgi:hypothetical protein
MLFSHDLARWLLTQPDLPMAYRGPAWCTHMQAEVTHAKRIRVATRDSIAEPMEAILIEADPDNVLKEIPRGQPSTTNQDSGTGRG